MRESTEYKRRSSSCGFELGLGYHLSLCRKFSTLDHSTISSPRPQKCVSCGSWFVWYTSLHRHYIWYMWEDKRKCSPWAVCQSVVSVDWSVGRSFIIFQKYGVKLHFHAPIGELFYARIFFEILTVANAKLFKLYNQFWLSQKLCCHQNYFKIFLILISILQKFVYII